MKIFENIDCMIGMEKYKDVLLSRNTLAIVDPPYQLDGWHDKGNNRYRFSAIEGSKRKCWDIQPNETYFNELKRGSINQIIWGGNYFGDYLGRCIAPIIWDKKNGDIHFADGELAWTSFTAGTLRFYRKHLSETELMDGRIHPTQKPIALYKWLLEKYGKGHDLILDTHVGSASSLIACEEMGFDYIGFELDKDYFDSATKRIENYRKQEKIFKPERKEIIQEKLAV